MRRKRKGLQVWRKKRPKRKVDMKVLKLRAQEREENLPTSIQGIPVDSKEEARFGLALMMLGVPFRYQVPVFGGTEFRGGQVIDFLLLVPPAPLPVYLQSTYWHGPTRRLPGRDKLNQARVARIPGWRDPVEVWDYEIPTLERALEVARQLGGR